MSKKRPFKCSEPRNTNNPGFVVDVNDFSLQYSEYFVMSTHLVMSLLQAIHSVIYVHTQVKKIYYSSALASHFGHFDGQALLKTQNLSMHDIDCYISL